MKHFQIIRQHDEKDCGSACLAMVAWHYGLKLPLVKCRQLIRVDNDGASMFGICQGAQSIGLRAVPLEGSWDELMDEVASGNIRFPFVARIINEEMYEHFVVVCGISAKEVTVGDPARGKLKYPIDLFREIWTGHVISFTPGENFSRGNENRHAMAKYIRLLTSQKKLIGSIAVISLFMSGVSLVGSLVFEYIVNSVIHTESGSTSVSAILSVLFSSLDKLCVAVIVLYLFQALVSVLRSYLLAVMSKNMDQPLTLDFFTHLIHLPIGFFSTRKSGEILSRFSDASSIREALSGSVLTLIIDSTMAILFGVYLCSISVPLFLISAAIMVGYAVVVLCFKTPIRRINQTSMENEALMTSHLKESIDGVETIKAYQLEEDVTLKTRGLFDRMIKTFVRGSITYSVKDAVISVIASVGTVMILWVGNSLCLKGTITIGSMISFYIVVGYFLDPVRNLIELQPSIQTAVVAAERLNDIMEIPSEKAPARCEDTVVSLKGDIAFDHVVFRYGYRNAIINDLSCKLKGGSKIAIVGESGSGKTTLMKLLMAFYYPESGSISVGGTDLSTLDPADIRSRIACVQQNVFFFSDTVRNNLTMGNPSITDGDIREALKKAMADEFVDRMPMGLDTILSENAINLSGGQRQRLALARAFLMRPDIMILDEATSNLDTITEQSIKNTIYRETKGITTFIIAHRLSTIRNCDLILVMDNGRIAECGSHTELIAAGGRYAEYWNSNM